MYHARMKAAHKRAALEQARAAEAAWVGAHQDQKGLEQYIDHLAGRDRRLPVEALGSALRAASAGVPTITRAEFLEMRKARNG